MQDSDDNKMVGVDVNRAATGGELPLDTEPSAPTPLGRNIMQGRKPQLGSSGDTFLGSAPEQDIRSELSEPALGTSTGGDGDRLPPTGNADLADFPQYDDEGSGAESDDGASTSSGEPKKRQVDAQEIIRAYQATKRGSEARREILAVEDTIRTALAAGVPLGPLHGLLHDRKLITIKKTRFVDLCIELLELSR